MKQAAVDCAARAGGPAGAGRRGRGPGIDGRGGPGLDGRGQGADGRGGRAVNARGGLDPGAPFDAGAMPPCSSGGGFGRYRSSGAPLPMFVTMLSQMAGRTVVDRTGLTGSYDIDLQWSPTPDQLPAGPPPPGVQVPQIDPNGPSLFTALQEQLGLRLESTRGPVEVLVIEQIHRPTEN
jgi:uncharacterized protein (TIGR03435 family)